MGDVFSLSFASEDSPHVVEEFSKSTTPSLPSVARPILVNVINGDRRCKIEATSEWNGCRLLEAVEKEMLIHIDLISLRYGSRPLGQDQKLSSLLGCDGRLDEVPSAVNLQLVVDTDQFPETLGPFSMCEVPLKACDFKQLKSSSRGGWTWELSQITLDHFFPGEKGKSSKKQKRRCLNGYASPVRPVMFDDDFRAAICVPEAACSIAWSYPLDRSEIPADDADSPELKYENHWFPEENQIVKAFLSFGGFMHFDDQGVLLKIMTIGHWREEYDQIGLHLGEKLPWDSTWTRALREDARFQKNTMQRLKITGVTEFCYLCPNEVVDEVSLPEIPYGGFAYLFDEKPWLNCYFPIMPLLMQNSTVAPFMSPLTFVDEDENTDGYDYDKHPTLARDRSTTFQILTPSTESPDRTRFNLHLSSSPSPPDPNLRNLRERILSTDADDHDEFVDVCRKCVKLKHACTCDSPPPARDGCNDRGQLGLRERATSGVSSASVPGKITNFEVARSETLPSSTLYPVQTSLGIPMMSPRTPRSREAQLLFEHAIRCKEELEKDPNNSAKKLAVVQAIQKFRMAEERE